MTDRPPPPKRRRVSSSAEDLQHRIVDPGTIKINVSGAYIIDNGEAASSPSSDSGVEEQGYEHDRRDIRLPNQASVVSHVAADIGGSLAKVVYFSREPGAKEPGGRLHFLRFESEKIDTCIDFMRDLQKKQRRANGGKQSELCVMATGGGAFKYYDRIKERLGVDVMREDEMECLIQGLDFFITEIPNEVFTYHDEDYDNLIHYTDAPADVYPYLLVNIGSGVSMIKVEGPSKFQRIGGTSLGGGTLWGLLSLLTGARTFDDMLAMADAGDNSTVDLLVGDIYGQGMGYDKIGLSERTIASSFGKVFKRKREAERDAEDGQLSREDGPEGYDAENDTTTTTTPEQVAKQQSDRKFDIGEGRMFAPQDISRSLLYAVRLVYCIPLLPESTDFITFPTVTTLVKSHICNRKNTTSSTYTLAAASSVAIVKPYTHYPLPSNSGAKATNKPFFCDTRVISVL
jgi:type II pantothenate kinase